MIHRPIFLRRLAASAAVALTLAGTTPALQTAAVATSKAAPALSAAERAAVEHISVETIRTVTVDLSSKEMEGRATATPGGERAARYIADRFAKLGLKPHGDNGTYLQAVP